MLDEALCGATEPGGEEDGPLMTSWFQLSIIVLQFDK